MTLQEALDDHDIVADWHAWAKYFGLPKLVEREPGALEGCGEAIGAIVTGRGSKLRRRGAALSKRRPRILQRRKVGDAARERRVFTGERLIVSYE